MASERTWIIYDYVESACIGIISQWVCQCQESRNLRSGRNFRHHTRALPSPLQAPAHHELFSTFSRWTAPVARPFQSPHSSSSPYPLPKECLSLGYIFPLSHVEWIAFLFLLLPLWAIWLKWSSVVLVFSILHNDQALRIWKTVI